MGAELVGAPGLRHEFQPRHAPCRGVDDAVPGYCPPALVLVHGHFLAQPARQLGERRVDPPLAQLRHSHDQRPIELARAPAAEGGGQLGGGGGGAPEQEHAAGVLVESVDEARSLAVEAQGIEQGVEMLGRARAALHRQTRRLVDGDDMGVAMYDHRPHRLGLTLVDPGRGLGGWRRRLGRQGRYADLLARLQALVGLGPPAVNPHLAGAQVLLKQTVGDLRQMPAEPAVEPDVGLVSGHRARLNAHRRNWRTSASPRNKAPTERITEAIAYSAAIATW